VLLLVPLSLGSKQRLPEVEQLVLQVVALLLPLVELVVVVALLVSLVAFAAIVLENSLVLLAQQLEWLLEQLPHPSLVVGSLVVVDLLVWLVLLEPVVGPLFLFA
jgi:hypothetical protein